MTDLVRAWNFIGCGKIYAPQACVGICQDKKIEPVFVQDHRAAIGVLTTRIQSMESLIRQLTLATPRDGEWEKSYRALRSRARSLLNAFDRGGNPSSENYPRFNYVS